MRTPTLQYLYLQKPVTMMVVICIISVLPWIGLGDFSTKGEPREAAVAISMLETGNWVLPQSYANEFAFKPPMAHWLMAAFSYPQGYVSGHDDSGGYVAHYFHRHRAFPAISMGR